MPQLLDLLEGQLDDRAIDGMSREIGADRQKTEQAVSMLLPMLIGGLSQNTHASPQGRQALAGALQRDHDGSLLDALGSGLSSGQGGGLLDALGGLLGRKDAGAGASRATDGTGILEHVLGSRRPAVERGVGNATGLDSTSVGRLLAMLAPLVMGALGRVQRQQGLDADGVGDLVDRERRTLEERAPATGRGGLLDLLDSNRDGKVDLTDDVAKVGLALGASVLLGRRRG